MEELIEIRWHGRGGQGVVTASELLAGAALEEGKYFQAFPEFGAERSGAPIRAFSRIGASPVRMHCSVTEPDAVVVLDPTLIGVISVAEGLTEGAALIVNTPLSPQGVREQVGLRKGRVYTLDATRIALDTIGRNIPNVPMVGALIKALGVVGRESMVREIKNRLGARLEEKMVEANLRALERAYEEVREG